MPLITGDRPARPDPHEHARLVGVERRCRALLDEPGPVTRAELLAALNGTPEPARPDLTSED